MIRARALGQQGAVRGLRSLESLTAVSPAARAEAAPDSEGFGPPASLRLWEALSRLVFRNCVRHRALAPQEIPKRAAQCLFLGGEVIGQEGQAVGRKQRGVSKGRMKGNSRPASPSPGCELPFREAPGWRRGGQARSEPTVLQVLGPRWVVGPCLAPAPLFCVRSPRSTKLFGGLSACCRHWLPFQLPHPPPPAAFRGAPQIPLASFLLRNNFLLFQG